MYRGFYQTVGGVACHGHEEDRSVAGLEQGPSGKGNGPGGVQLPWDPAGAEKSLGTREHTDQTYDVTPRFMIKNINRRSSAVTFRHTANSF